jgi:DNA-binding response OmpR family regulator
MKQYILIVDDDPSTLRHIEASLKKNGFTAVSCRGGEFALEWAAARSPLLVIVDSVMPGLDGVETLRYMRLLPSLYKVPVIMLTEEGQPISPRDLEECGVQTCVQKPVDSDQLCEEIKRLLGIRSAAA